MNLVETRCFQRLTAIRGGDEWHSNKPFAIASATLGWALPTSQNLSTIWLKMFYSCLQDTLNNMTRQQQKEIKEERLTASEGTRTARP
ncbi:hypothetical protein, partial [Coleofasciculus sp.]